MIKFEDLIVGHYYGGTSSKGSVAQWDGEDFIISRAPLHCDDVEQWAEEWEHEFLAHPQQTGDDVKYGMIEIFTPYENLTLKEYTDGES